nr:hypothetical protein [uncultured bacterium]
MTQERAMHSYLNRATFALTALFLTACVTIAPQPAAPPPATATAAPTETSPSNAADVLFVAATQAQDGRWTFAVTVQHPDTGWDSYADGWDVVTPDGTVLLPDPDAPFTRLLLHPHVDEQPFTRSQSGIVIPDDVTTVRVRAHSSVAGFSGREVTVDLNTPSGPDYEVQAQP